MEYEDTLSIATPEGLRLELVLAGVGSRFVAFLIDTLLEGAVLAVLAIAGGVASAVIGGPGGGGAALVVALVAVVTFLVVFGYHVAFEVLARGRTPGKRAVGLRVVLASGQPVTFTASAVRNIVRLIDALPGLYLVGMVAILVSGRNQRLGDLAGATLVVRDRRPEKVWVVPAYPNVWPPGPQGARGWPALSGTPSPSLGSAGWDSSAVTGEDLVTVRRFLGRRHELTPEARRQVAEDLAVRLWAKVVGPPDAIEPESFLEQLVEGRAHTYGP